VFACPVATLLGLRACLRHARPAMEYDDVDVRRLFFPGRGRSDFRWPARNIKLPAALAPISRWRTEADERARNWRWRSGACWPAIVFYDQIVFFRPLWPGRQIPFEESQGEDRAKLLAARLGPAQPWFRALNRRACWAALRRALGLVQHCAACAVRSRTLPPASRPGWRALGMVWVADRARWRWCACLSSCTATGRLADWAHVTGPLA